MAAGKRRAQSRRVALNSVLKVMSEACFTLSGFRLRRCRIGVKVWTGQQATTHCVILVPQTVLRSSIVRDTILMHPSIVSGMIRYPRKDLS